MEVKTSTVNIRVVNASEGYMLCRKDEPLESAYFSPSVYLGTGDSADNYMEIPEADAKAEMERREKERY